MCPYRDHVEAGALMGYAVDLAELLRRMADDVHQILKGACPHANMNVITPGRNPWNMPHEAA
jgi:ABC-type uncharacterized transport system substrate-binding protein